MTHARLFAAALLSLSLVSGCALAKNRNIRASGVEAPAVIVSARDTRTRVNGIPVLQLELDVRGEGGEVFRAVAKQVVEITDIPQVQPGQEVMVRYDPENPERALIVALGHADERGLEAEEAKALLAHAAEVNEYVNREGVGIAAAGIVTRYDDLGVRVNEVATLVELGVKVIPEAGEPFDAIIVAPILEGRESRYEPGSEVSLRYDPADPGLVHFDTAKSTQCTSSGAGHVDCD